MAILLALRHPAASTPRQLTRHSPTHPLTHLPLTHPPTHPLAAHTLATQPPTNPRTPSPTHPPSKGNIAGDSPRCRDLVLSYQMLPPLVRQLSAADGRVGWGRIGWDENCGRGAWGWAGLVGWDGPGYGGVGVVWGAARCTAVRWGGMGGGVVWGGVVGGWGGGGEKACPRGRTGWGDA